MKKSLLLLVLFFFFFAGSAEAHPGRKDANGGHTCRTNCEQWGLEYGEYHYHGGGGASTGGSDTAPVQEIVQEAVVFPTNTPIPLRIPTKTPTRIPTAKPTPYVETAMDKKKMFKVVSVIDGDTFDINLRGKSNGLGFWRLIRLRRKTRESPSSVLEQKQRKSCNP
jgi:hypothetical protein